jgi:predicted glycoside hydrolase/deacetylase ChbG (UPF0249 family)
MRIAVHADDLGASNGVTAAILRCVDEGPITSASVLVNGPAFEAAADACRRRPGLRPVLHFNLVEGVPLSPAREVDLLVDEAGTFRHDFTSLWRLWAMSSARERERLAAQVRAELGLQIARMRSAVGGGGPVALDGHLHVHLLPFVLREVLAACDAGAVARVRVVREPLYVVPREAGWFLAANLAKHAVLDALSARAQGPLAARGVAFPSFFVGVLYTSRMSPAVVEAALERLRARGVSDDAEVEVLFHPGGGAPEEAPQWARRPEHQAFYLSPRRARESEALRSAALRAVLARYGT